VDILHFFHIHFLTKFVKLNQQFDIFVLNNYLQKIRFKDNHPSNFDNVHSFTDLITQLEYNFRYSIVESHTKRYIVVNKCELSSNSKKQIINNLKKDNLEFKTKIKNIVDNRLSIKTKGHDYDFYQIEEIRSDIYEQVTKEHMPEFEEKISKYFDDNTGLKLYVHDRV